MEAPRIWVPKAKIIEPREEIALGLGMAGEWRLRAHKGDPARARLDTGWFKNLITNQGLNHPGLGLAYGDSCSVGASDQAPSVQDTALISYVASTVTVRGGSVKRVGTPGTADFHLASERTFRFAQGAAAGVLAEIGVGEVLYSRALILDEMNQPSPIEVHADEFLDATYRHRWYPATHEDITGSFTISGSGVHNYTLRACNANAWGGAANTLAWAWTAGALNAKAASLHSGAIGAVTEVPAGDAAESNSASFAAYTTGTYYRDFAYVWGLENGNLAGGANSVSFNAGAAVLNSATLTRYQFSVSPAIDKNSYNILTLNFRQSWARHIP